MVPTASSSASSASGSASGSVGVGSESRNQKYSSLLSSGVSLSVISAKASSTRVTSTVPVVSPAATVSVPAVVS